MSLEEKIGQLFVIPVCPLRDEAHFKDVESCLEMYHVGALIPKQATLETHSSLLNRLQERRKLLIIQDAEWGLGMRIKDFVSFPRNLTLGAIQEEKLLTLCGEEIGKECRKAGVHINLAPVVDVNTNPKNPIINNRSFGDDAESVARKASLLMKGMKESGLFVCLKHFPGHGDTETDSHTGLPLVSHTLKRLKAVEFIPFKRLIEGGADAVMPGHLMVPALDPHHPASLSKKTLDYLQNSLGFKGLIITDALNMKALMLHHTPEEIAVMAFLAGNDLLLYGDHIHPKIDEILQDTVPRAFKALLSYVQKNPESQKSLDERILKILKIKEQFKDEGKIEPFEKKENSLCQKLFDEAITSVHEADKMIPVLSQTSVIEVRDALPDTLMRIKNREEKGDLLLVLYGSPYLLLDLPRLPTLVAYEDTDEARNAIQKILKGELPLKGKLPIDLKCD